jgi:hypothetical protein
MVSTLCYIILPVVFIAGLLRKCREYSWGRCKSKSNLEGRIFIVTGSNSGVGKETVKELAKRKATVILACRNLQAAKNTAQEIRSYVPGAELVIIHKFIFKSNFQRITIPHSLLSINFKLFTEE